MDYEKITTNKNKQAFVHINYIQNLEDQKFFCWSIFSVVNYELCFNSIKQKIIAESIIDAEHIKLYLVFKQTIWMSHLIFDIECISDNLAVFFSFGNYKIFLQPYKKLSNELKIKDIHIHFH